MPNMAGIDDVVAERHLATACKLQMIWDGAPHCAFTDLVRFKNRWFCTFREAKAHALCPGKIRVISSMDGLQWTSVALISQRSVDLRDPKFLVLSPKKILLVTGATRLVKGVPVGRHTLFRESEDGQKWSEGWQAGSEGDWLWRPETDGKAVYGISYRLPEKRRWTVHLMKSADGREWHDLCELRVPGLPNEAVIRFRGSTAIALVRREAGRGAARIGTSEPPYTRWTWASSGQRTGGPNFIVLEDGTLLAATRIWKKRKPLVALCLMKEDSLSVIHELPSGGDCGYPGMAVHRKTLHVSYYSSHEGRSRIYLAIYPPGLLKALCETSANTLHSSM